MGHPSHISWNVELHFNDFFISRIGFSSGPPSVANTTIGFVLPSGVLAIEENKSKFKIHHKTHVTWWCLYKAIEFNSGSSVVTKWNIASDAAKSFHTVGWLAPVIIREKFILQNVWLQTLDWDDPVPVDTIIDKWRKFEAKLSAVQSVSCTAFKIRPSVLMLQVLMQSLLQRPGFLLDF